MKIIYLSFVMTFILNICIGQTPNTYYITVQKYDNIDSAKKNQHKLNKEGYSTWIVSDDKKADYKLAIMKFFDNKKAKTALKLFKSNQIFNDLDIIKNPKQINDNSNYSDLLYYKDMDGKWITSQEKDAEYLRLITFNNSKDPISLSLDFYITGELQWKGIIYKLIPEEKKDGIATWYFMNGKKSQEIKYSLNIPNGFYLKWNEKGDTLDFNYFIKGKTLAEVLYKKELLYLIEKQRLFNKILQDTFNIKVSGNESTHLKESIVINLKNIVNELNILGVKNYNSGLYEKADSMFLNAFYIENTIFPNKDSSIALLNLREVYKQKPFLRKNSGNKSLSFNREKNYPKALRCWLPYFYTSPYINNKNKIYLKELYFLALLYENSLDFENAELNYLEALELNKKCGNDTIQANILNSLGFNYMKTNTTKSEYFLKQSLEITKRIYDEKSSEYMQVLNNLAVTYKKNAKYRDALYLYENALKVTENIFFGKKKKKLDVTNEAIDFATSLNNLGSFFEEIGNLDDAKNYYSKAAQTIEPYNIEYYAITLMNIGGIISDNIDSIAESERLYLKSYSILKEIPQRKCIYIPILLNNLAEIYAKRKQYGKAISYYLKAKETIEECNIFTLDYIKIINGLGYTYFLNNKIDSAKYYGELSLDLYNKHFDKSSLQYFDLVSTMIIINAKTNNQEEAKKLLIESCELLSKYISENFNFLTEKEKQPLINIANNFFDPLKIYVLKNCKNDLSLTELLYNNTLITKKILLDYSTKINSQSQMLNDSDLNVIKLNLNQRKGEMLNLKEIGGNENFINKKQTQIDSLEKLIVRQLSKNKILVYTPITWKDVQNKIKIDEAAIEFVYIKHPNKDSSSYAALVLRKNDKNPFLIPLFYEKQLDSVYNLIKLTKEQIDGPNRDYYYNDELYTKDAFYKLIWKPIDSVLINIKTVYLSLDKALYNISFNALKISENQYLIDKYNIVYLNSTRSLTDSLKTIPDSISFCLFGNIDYDTFTNNGCRSRNKYWEKLTEKEVNKIKEVSSNKFFGKREIYEGNNASEKNLDSVIRTKKFNIIHFSTHGFYHPLNDRDSTYNGVDNSLTNSGIILSGANCYFKNIDNNGILTAFEIKGMDLNGTNLVIVSACESARGDIKSNEGVYGLQRAFKIAGVDYQIMTLWKVDEENTAMFMEYFYKNLIKTKDIWYSFNDAQKKLKENETSSSPYYWAPFILVR